MTDETTEPRWHLLCVACGDVYHDGDCYCGCRERLPLTPKDVQWLRDMAGDYEGRGGYFPIGKSLLDLADRIAALLPPEHG